jgi:hypothetical protein
LATTTSAALESRAWATGGRSLASRLNRLNTKYGVLSLDSGRLSFRTDSGRELFSAPATDVKLKVPMAGLGATFTVVAGDEQYVIEFASGGIGALMKARKLAKPWIEALPIAG